MALPVGFTQHVSGYWFKLSDQSGPYVFDGTTMTVVPIGVGDTNGAIVQSGASSTFWNYAAATGGIANSTTAVTIKAAAGAGVRNYLKTAQINADALTAATEFAIRDGAAGTVLYRTKFQTAATAPVNLVFDPPLKGTANTLLEIVTLTLTVAGGVFFNGQGFTGS